MMHPRTGMHFDRPWAVKELNIFSVHGTLIKTGGSNWRKLWTGMKESKPTNSWAWWEQNPMRLNLKQWWQISFKKPWPKIKPRSTAIISRHTILQEHSVGQTVNGTTRSSTPICTWSRCTKHSSTVFLKKAKKALSSRLRGLFSFCPLDQIYGK